MHNFGWIKTRNQEALNWTEFTNGDVLAFEEDIQRLIQGAVRVDDINTFLVKEGRLYNVQEEDKLVEVARLKEGVKFKRLWSVKFE